MDVPDPEQPGSQQPATRLPRRLPLFPLGSVVFPGASLPLHIFEERYRVLVRRLLAAPAEERLFGTFAIREGYEVGSHGVHSVHRTGCLLQLTEAVELEDGRFDVLAVGRGRIHLEGIESAASPYLVGAVQLLPDPEPRLGSPEHTAELEAARAASERFEEYRVALTALRGASVLEGELPEDPRWFSYALAATCLLTLRERQTLLEADTTLARLQLLAHGLRGELRAMQVVPSLPATEVARTRWSPN